MNRAVLSFVTTLLALPAFAQASDDSPATTAIVGKTGQQADKGIVAPDMRPTPESRHEASRALRKVLGAPTHEVRALEREEKIKLLGGSSKTELGVPVEITPRRPFDEEHDAALIGVGVVVDPAADRIIMPPAQGEDRGVIMPPTREEGEQDDGEVHGVIMPPTRESAGSTVLPRAVLQFRADPGIRYLVVCLLKTSDETDVEAKIESEMRYWGGLGDVSFAHDNEHLVHVAEPVDESTLRTYVISIDAKESKLRRNAQVELYGCEITPEKAK